MRTPAGANQTWRATGTDEGNGNVGEHHGRPTSGRARRSGRGRHHPSLPGQRSRRGPGRPSATEYDWRRCEAKLNSLEQFVTTIDGLDIHFIHARSPHPDALPLIVSHGWPGSIIEQLKIIEPVTNPTAHGGSAPDAFDVVIPSLPGYGFSGKPAVTGWGPTGSRGPGRC